MDSDKRYKRQTRVLELINAIKYQFPRFATTKSPCLTAECSNMARGKSKCVCCLHTELAGITKNPFTTQGFVHSVENTNRLECELLDLAEALDDKEENGEL